MEPTPDSFDWKVFSFISKVGLLVLIVGVAGHFGLVYASSLLTSSSSSELPVLTLATSSPATEAPSSDIVLSTTTPEHVLNALTIAEVVPSSGKFIAADLVHMEMYLYQDGTTTAEFPIIKKGRPGSPYETPGGFYTILTKEQDHFNKREQVHMPYSMEFYGNYFIHGWPVYADGTPVSSNYSGGCIRLSTEDAARVFTFADRGTRVFVYDTGVATSAPSVALSPSPLPPISAASFLVADVDTGDVYAEHDVTASRPIASVTKLMTALVANETIMFDEKITIPRGILSDVAVATDTTPETFVVGDLLYPLLMESNNNIADVLARHYSTGAFVSWMNTEAKALDMASTTYVDASGVSRNNVSTPEDLYRLAVYLANKKSFVWDITRTPTKTIVADDGSRFTFANFNEFSNLDSFIGGKVGHTDVAQDTMVSVFTIPVDGIHRRIAVIVLGSENYTTDTKQLADWFYKSATSGAGTACASCALPEAYPKIRS